MAISAILSGPRARLAENRRASEFLITVSGRISKRTPMSGRYTAAFFSLGDQPLLASPESLEGERPARDIGARGREEERRRRRYKRTDGE